MSSPLEKLVGRARATIPEMLDKRAERTPDAPFLLWENQRWTYAEGLQETKRFAGWVLTTTSARGDPKRIASFLPNRAETVWTWLGTLFAGAVYVPLNYNHRGDILQDMLRRSGADVLVTDLAGVGYLSSLQHTGIGTVLIVDDKEPTKRPAGVRVATWPEVTTTAPAVTSPQSPNDPATVMYTSGTTGRAKAVLVSHNQLCRGASAVSHSLQIDSHDVVHAWLPLYHVAAQLDSVLCTMIGGGAVALFPTFSGSRFWQQVRTCKATVFVGFSNVLEILWAIPSSPEDAACTLRVGMIGGIPTAIHREFEKRFSVRLCDVYGMTEAEPIALPEPDVPLPAGSCGRANPDFEITILDESDNPLPAGEAGEIAVRPQVPDVMFIRYEDDERATLDACSTLWLHTGDLGRIDENDFLYFLDRRKHAIRRRGENISSWELENIVASHPAIEECCAVGVPASIGEEEVKVVVVPAAEGSIDPLELHRWCVERMAQFMVPRYIDIVDTLPRSPAGKLLKECLRQVTSSNWDADRMAY